MSGKPGDDYTLERETHCLVWFVAGLVLLFIVHLTPAWAARGGAEPNAEQVMAVIHERLNLTEEQATAVKPIIEEQISKRRQVVDKARSMSRQERRSLRGEFKAIQAETESRLESILTAEQMDEFRAWQDERRQKMRKQRGKRSN